jgi:predicted RNase H-like nuclease (RuvC/YqgF family)
MTMETAIGEILSYFGVPGCVGAALYFILKEIIKRNNDKIKQDYNKLEKHQAEIEKKNEEVKKAQDEATSQRTQNRDLKMEQMEQRTEAKVNKVEQKVDSLDSSFGKHIQGHVNFEKEIFNKIDTMQESIYERLNPIAETVSKIQGFLEAQQMMMESKSTSQRKR